MKLRLDKVSNERKGLVSIHKKRMSIIVKKIHAIPFFHFKCPKRCQLSSILIFLRSIVPYISYWSVVKINHNPGPNSLPVDKAINLKIVNTFLCGGKSSSYEIEICLKIEYKTIKCNYSGWKVAVVVSFNYCLKPKLGISSFIVFFIKNFLSCILV